MPRHSGTHDAADRRNSSVHGGFSKAPATRSDFHRVIYYRTDSIGPVINLTTARTMGLNGFMVFYLPDRTTIRHSIDPSLIVLDYHERGTVFVDEFSRSRCAQGDQRRKASNCGEGPAHWLPLDRFMATNPAALKAHLRDATRHHP